MQQIANSGYKTTEITEETPGWMILITDNTPLFKEILLQNIENVKTRSTKNRLGQMIEPR